MEFVDELDFTQENKQFFELKGKVCKKNFERRNLPCYLMHEGDEVKSFIKKFIKDHTYIKTIAISDGVSLYQLNLYEWLQEEYGKDCEIIIPLERSQTGHYAVFGNEPQGRMNLPYEEWREKMDVWYETCRKSLISDLLIISANAITENGEIVSVDGLGNRVAGMIFGPRHVICVVGKNKIVTDIDKAMDRIHNYAAPMTYIRHNIKHHASFINVPCVKTGRCMKCCHEYSSCRNIVTVRGQIKQHSDRIHLVIVNQNLGF